MKLRLAIAFVLAAAGGFSLAHVTAQVPMRAANAVNRVAFENEKVRVVEYQSGPNGPACGFGRHSHPAHLTILLTDARVRIVGADGKATVEEGKAGDMFWEPAATHEVADVSGKEARCYVIELKDGDWKPSTGLAR